MNALKKVAALLVGIVMLLQIPAFAQASLNDVIGTPCEMAVRLISALGIMQGDDNGNFSPDANITKAEFAQILMKLLKLDEVVDSFTPSGLFSDVPDSSPYINAIELGASIGAISGIGDGKFDPEGKVTGEQAIKMLVYAIGYEIQAEGNGGYPVGYTMVASSKGMLKGIDKLTLGGPITRSSVAIMVYNAMQIDILKQESFGANITYSTVKDVNILTQNFKVFTEEGIITANSTTAFRASSTLKKGYIQLNTTTAPIMYSIIDGGDTGIEVELGKYVKVFCSYNAAEDNDLKAIAYEVLSSKNITQEIDVSNIEIAQSSSTQIVYWKDKNTDVRTAKADLSAIPPAAVIYNGAYKVGNLIDLLANKEGKVVLIDNNTDGNYDVVCVTAYENYVVGSTDKENYILFDKMQSNRSISMDFEDTDKTVSIVDKNGEECEFDSISENDIVSVAASMDGATRQIIKAIVSFDTVAGIISEKGLENSKNVVTLDSDESYTFARNVDSTEIDKYAVGDQVTLYLDAFGKVAYVKQGGISDMSYGLVLKTADDTGVETGFMIKMLTKDTKFVWFDVADRVTVDGTVFKTTHDIKGALSFAPIKSNTKVELPTGVYFVRYSTNVDGKIDNIDTPYLAKAGNATLEDSTTIKYDKDESLHSFTSFVKSSTGMRYAPTMQLLGLKVPFTSSALVFKLPTDANDFDLIENFSVGTVAKTLKSQLYQNIRTFKLDPDPLAPADLMVYQVAPRGEFTSDSKDISMFVLDRITTSIDPDTGELLEKLYGMQDGVAKSLMVADNIKLTTGINTGSFNSLSAAGYVQGDVFRYYTDSKGRVSIVEDLFRYDNNIANLNPTGLADIDDDEASSFTMHGYVANMKGNTLQIIGLKKDTTDDMHSKLNTLSDADWMSLSDGGWQDDVIPGLKVYLVKVSTACKIMVYDPSKAEGKKVTKGSIADITDHNYYPKGYSRVLIRYRGLTDKDMIIFKDPIL